MSWELSQNNLASCSIDADRTSVKHFLSRKLPDDVVTGVLQALQNFKGYRLSAYTEDEIEAIALKFRTAPIGSLRLQLDIARGLLRLQDGLDTWSSTVSSCASQLDRESVAGDAEHDDVDADTESVGHAVDEALIRSPPTLVSQPSALATPLADIEESGDDDFEESKYDNFFEFMYADGGVWHYVDAGARRGLIRISPVQLQLCQVTHLLIHHPAWTAPGLFAAKCFQNLGGYIMVHALIGKVEKHRVLWATGGEWVKYDPCEVPVDRSLQCTHTLGTEMQLRLGDIGFTHKSIQGLFVDGRPLHAMRDELVSGRKSVRDIPRICVVQHDEQYFGRDNRMLWVMKQALHPAEVVPALLVPFPSSLDDCCRPFVELRQRQIYGFDPALTEEVVLQAQLSRLRM